MHAALVREEELNTENTSIKLANDKSTVELQAALAREEKLDEEVRHLRLRFNKLNEQYRTCNDELSSLNDELRDRDALKSSDDALRSDLVKKLEKSGEKLDEMERELMENKKESRLKDERIRQHENDAKANELELQRLQKKLEKEAFLASSAQESSGQFKEDLVKLTKENASLQLKYVRVVAVVSCFVASPLPLRSPPPLCSACPRVNKSLTSTSSA